MTPTVGRIVHYAHTSVPDPYDPASQVHFQPLAAIIVSVDLPPGPGRRAAEWNPLDEAVYVVGLQVFTGPGTVYITNATYSDFYRPNCWTWPPMV